MRVCGLIEIMLWEGDYSSKMKEEENFGGRMVRILCSRQGDGWRRWKYKAQKKWTRRKALEIRAKGKVEDWKIKLIWRRKIRSKMQN